MQRARKLSAIDSPHLSITLRQIAIRTLLRFVNADVKRTIHRLQTKLSLFESRWREHRIAIILFVAAQLPKLALRDVRRVNKTVVALDQFFPQIIFHLLA